MTELYLVRHGQARQIEWQAYGPDPALTPLGHVQAAQRGAWLAEHGPFDAFYCSPLRRARQTAGIIGAAMGRQPVVVPPLAEWEPPRYMSPLRWLINRTLRRVSTQGTAAGVIGRGMRDEVRVWRYLRGQMPPWRRFMRRVGRTTMALARRHAGGRLILVSHGGTIRATLAYFGVDPPSLYHFDAIGLCSVSILHLLPQGAGATLVCFDDCATIPHSRLSGRPD